MKSATRLHWLFVLSLFPTFLFSQTPAFQFKLQLLEADKWGVFVKSDENIGISNTAITISAQVTIVMPINYTWNELESVSGEWISTYPYDGVPELPNNRIQYFQLLSEILPIHVESGVETLLFTFTGDGNCPSELYLWQNDTQLFPCPNDCWWTWNSPLNDLTVYDILGGTLYHYQHNYAFYSWSCHDNDSDGILNALEDTNGNGVFDAGVDVSDLNEANSGMTPGCVKLKLQLLPDSTGWGVFAKPFDGYLPSGNTMATEGRITVVAPANMPLEGLESVTGQWSLTVTTLGLPSHPSSKFLTFEMLSNATPIGLSSAVETMLFKFDKVGECPNFLRLMEGNIPNSLSPNTLNGTDTNNLTSNGFEYCGVYNRKAWRCKNGGIWSNIGSIIVVTTDTLDAPQPGATDRDSDFSKENLTEGQDWFTASPNPAGDFVNIVFREKPEIEATPTITLWDLQGRKLQEKVVENAATQLDLSGLPAGVYLVSLAQNGRVLQREKLVLK